MADGKDPKGDAGKNGKDGNTYPPREVAIEATFKFTSADFKIGDLKVTSSVYMDDVKMTRLPLKRQKYPNDYAAHPVMIDEDLTGVSFVLLKLAAVPSNKGIAPVFVATESFNINEPKNCAQKLDTADATAVFWSKAIGQPQGIHTEEGVFYFYNPNAVDVVLDVVYGTYSKLPGHPPQEGDDNGDEQEGEDEPAKLS